MSVAVESVVSADPAGAVTARGDRVETAGEATHLYRRLVRATGISIVQGVLACVGLVVLGPSLVARPMPQVEAIGRHDTFQVVPLGSPAMSDSWISHWAARTIATAYAINPVDFKDGLTKVRHRFTVTAWRAFAASYKAGGASSDLEKLLSEELIGFAQTTADPVIVHRTFGREANFTVVFPQIVTWENANEEISRRYIVHVVVRRASLGRHPSGLAITQFSASEEGI
ncbi:MAG: DotI/IcmL family type IV secretion protein [Acidiphilium sp.]|nr:DotI/IcmL family type IV secretion protein [Acidiphilium sp.]MDD4937056.1 DotI/IcmL family type IV secretion protein [Acidiphilium sp.]